MSNMRIVKHCDQEPKDKVTVTIEHQKCNITVTQEKEVLGEYINVSTAVLLTKEDIVDLVNQIQTHLLLED